MTNAVVEYWTGLQESSGDGQSLGGLATGSCEHSQFMESGLRRSAR